MALKLTITDTTAPASTTPAAPRPAMAPRPLAKAARAATAPKAATAAPKAASKALAAPATPRISKRAQAAADALASAQTGKLPAAPSFDAATHDGYRKRLLALLAAGKAGDLATLVGDATEPKGSSRVIICRWRDLAIVALKARAAKAA